MLLPLIVGYCFVLAGGALVAAPVIFDGEYGKFHGGTGSCQATTSVIAVSGAIYPANLGIRTAQS